MSTALAIARNLGTDATEEFLEIHSLTAWKQLHDFQVGVLLRPSDTTAKDVDVKAFPENHRVPTQNTHPMPSWLSADRDFWARYGGGVTAQVLAYLGAQGYPQDEMWAETKESEAVKQRVGIQLGCWQRKMVTAVAVCAASTLLKMYV